MSPKANCLPYLRASGFWEFEKEEEEAEVAARPRGSGVLFTGNHRHFHLRLTGQPARSWGEDLSMDLSDLILAATSDLSVTFESIPTSRFREL